MGECNAPPFFLMTKLKDRFPSSCISCSRFKITGCTDKKGVYYGRVIAMPCAKVNCPQYKEVKYA